MPSHAKRLLGAYAKLDFHNDGHSTIDAERFRAFQLLIARRLRMWGLDAKNWETDTATPRCIQGFLESWGEHLWPPHKAQRGHLKMARITGVRVNVRAHLIGYDGKRACGNQKMLKGTKAWNLSTCVMAESTIGLYLRKFIMVLLERALPTDNNLTDEQLMARVLRLAGSNAGGAAGGAGSSNSDSMSGGIGGGNGVGGAQTQVPAHTQIPMQSQAPSQASLPALPQVHALLQAQAPPQTLPPSLPQLPSPLEALNLSLTLKPDLNPDNIPSDNPNPYADAIALAYHQANAVPKSPDGIFFLAENPPPMPETGPNPPADFPWWMYVALGDKMFGDGSRFDGIVVVESANDVVYSVQAQGADERMDEDDVVKAGGAMAAGGFVAEDDLMDVD